MSDTYQVTSGDPVMTALGQVATDVTDIIRGFETMAERAEDDLRPFVERLLELHRAHAAELYLTLDKLGARPENAGSIMGAVHTAVATARDWFDGLDTSALSAILDGEDRLVDQYTSAIDQIPADNEGAALLDKQRSALREHVAALRN